MIDQNYNKLRDFLVVYLKDNNISENGKLIYDSITNISKSDDGYTLVESEFRMIDFDRLCEFAYSKNKASSMDALYLTKNSNKFKLYFIEFKRVNLENSNNKKSLKTFIEKSEEQLCSKENTDCYIKNNLDKLKGIYKTYEDKRLNQLKRKPLESLLLVLPKAYQKYCNKEKIKKENQIKDKDLIKLLYTMHNEIIIVEDFNNKKETERHMQEISLQKKLEKKI